MRRLAPAVALAVASPAAAQLAQPWPALQITAPLAGKLSVGAEGVFRVAPDGRRSSQFRSRGWLNHQTTKRLRLSIGYGHLVTYQPSGLNGMENQIAEQASWAAITGPHFHLLSRTRLEERFQRGDDGTSLRLREQLRAELPVSRDGPALVLWSEPFVNLARTKVSYERLDQVRSFAGFLVPAGRHMSFEIGYLRQYQPRTTGPVFNDVIPITVAYRF